MPDNLNFFAKATSGPLAATLDEERETRVRDVFVVYEPVDGKVLRIRHESEGVVDPDDPVT